MVSAVTALAFIALWVLLGVIVFAVAMRGGPRGAREALYSEGRAGRRAIGAGFVVAYLGIGLAVPLLVLVDKSDEKEGPDGIVLTTAQVDGRELFARKCSMCHTLGAVSAVGKVGPNLDQLKPPKELILDAVRNGRARGAGQMPPGLVDGEDAENVAGFVAAVAGR